MAAAYSPTELIFGKDAGPVDRRAPGPSRSRQCPRPVRETTYQNANTEFAFADVYAIFTSAGSGAYLK
jgi:hypothetical protein